MYSERRPILIVDDNAATRYAIRRALEHHGYQVAEAGTGADGEALLARGEAAAMVLDVNLPDMSGFDIVRRLRLQESTALLPVIHVSAAAIATGDMVTGLEAGADAYLIHPVDPDVLLATLRTLLRARRAEDALRRSEATFREIFELTGAPIAVVDEGLRISEANVAFHSLMGLQLGDGLCDVLAEGEERDGTRASILQALEARKRWQGQVSLENAGRRRDTEWRLAPYGKASGWLLFVQDVTVHANRERARQRELDDTNQELAFQIAERRRAEQQLQQAQKMDALGQLTGGIAHDFNNLLTSIMGGIDMATLEIQRGKSERLTHFLGVASAAASRAAALTQRMLAFARKKPLDAQPFDVNERIASLNDMLRRTIGENVRLEVELDRSKPVVEADADTLDNSIINLVVNARDALAASGGAVTVTTTRRELRDQLDLADGGYVEVRVSDNGVGIEAEVLEKVFEPFFTTKPLGKGTGLGLSMVYGFARQSGGTVRIHSEVGRGTDVIMLLPCCTASPVVVTAAVGEPVPVGGHHVLLVDDTDLVRMMAQEVLVDAGYRVSEAADASAALALLEAHADIALLLTDMGLPGMNGRDLATAARKRRPDLPVLFITGYAEISLDGGSLLEDRMDLLSKPYSLKDLLARVQALLA